MSNTTTATWPSSSQPSNLPAVLKELFAATPLGLVLAAVKTGR
ncbi:MAG: hypothetical protein ACJ8GO_01770 [Ramlibacter sp.]